MALKFGTAGVPISAKEHSTESGIKRVKELGLEAMEVEFVHGVRMKQEKADKVGAIAAENEILLSCHAPYYINLNSKEKDKVEASRERIIHTARIAYYLGAHSIVFHPAFYGNNKPEEVFSQVLKELLEVRAILDKENNGVILRPETTGKPTQFGTLRETARLASKVNGLLPCIDFSHIYARGQGNNNSYDKFCAILEGFAQALGDSCWLDNVHFHISGIEFDAKGEKQHRIFAESEFNYQELLKACKTFDLSGTVICESPNLEEDALRMRDLYQQQ